ncbi:hypothetical protein GNF10_17465 [Nostoc sp. UCD121]|uniref:hypothetical protein n=2 Tax=unclassified Nostoc TaxID=2593658 RepID=UPI00162492D6|nr:hypothetical protein [Nostoc sp. UCD120]MBC1277697.1 hypothetical protein [Nostoc sp. UCD121]MBC1296183.1 hypothetical protein [Nostoc sp. UCD122]
MLDQGISRTLRMTYKITLMDASTLTLIFQVFLPVIVIAGVGLAVYFLMRILPEDIKDALNLDLTNPSKNKRKK